MIIIKSFVVGNAQINKGMLINNLWVKMENKETIGEQLRTDTESIKLFKNTKGYNWEIKILEINIERLEEINNQMSEKFGGLIE